VQTHRRELIKDVFIQWVHMQAVMIVKTLPVHNPELWNAPYLWLNRKV